MDSSWCHRASCRPSTGVRTSTTSRVPPPQRPPPTARSPASRDVHTRGWLARVVELFEGVPEDVGGPAGRIGGDAQLFHSRGVQLDVVAFVEVESAGELLDIDHVGQVLVGETQDAKGPTS